jgi:uncharacterized protein with NRDE domain
MCLIVVGLGAAPGYSLLVAANRDERHARPAASAAWWPHPPHVLGGRDLEAGGTWLAVDRRGRFAAVTNIRDAQRRAGLRSRGSLVTEYLAGPLSAERYALRAAGDGADFGGFNLLLYDGDELWFASNRSPAARLGSGLHAFSNAPPGIDWPKTATARARAERLLREPAPVEPLLALLAERDAEGAVERSHFVVGPTYGTRCSTVVLIDTHGRFATFAERRFDEAGRPVGDVEERFAIDRAG